MKVEGVTVIRPASIVGGLRLTETIKPNRRRLKRLILEKWLKVWSKMQKSVLILRKKRSSQP